ncbi:MAG TPA: hypothetical protein VHG72_13860 [Polyangia bacterium]|nr:hypothetical protein [Polyangia bacterium]
MSTSLRHDQLREVLGFVRSGHQALATGNMGRAVRALRDAAAKLEFTRALHHPRVDVCATAGLARLVEDLEWRVERAVEPAPKADLGDLVAMMAAVIGVLNTRDHLGIPATHVKERANAAVAALAMNYDVRELSIRRGTDSPGREISPVELAECLANGESP